MLGRSIRLIEHWNSNAKDNGDSGHDHKAKNKCFMFAIDNE